MEYHLTEDVTVSAGLIGAVGEQVCLLSLLKLWNHLSIVCAYYTELVHCRIISFTL